MKIAYGTYATPTLTLEETIPLLAGMGYEGIEICVNAPKHNRAMLEDFTTERRVALRSRLAEHGLGIPALFMLGGVWTADAGAHRANLERMRVAGRIAGEILHTPGHSDHCVSLLLDDGSVCTGDLPLEPYAFDNPVALATWRRLRERGATRVYPAHGPIRPLDETPG